SYLLKHLTPHEIYTLSLHDALPILALFKLKTSPTNIKRKRKFDKFRKEYLHLTNNKYFTNQELIESDDLKQYKYLLFVKCRYSLDRKSTRLNSSHVSISYAVFCLKK